MDDGFRVDGLDDLNRLLDGIAGEDGVKIIEGALQDAGEVVKKAIEDRAPVRPDLPSTTALPIDWLRHDVAVKKPRPTSKGIIVTIGPNRRTKHVARWVEYGHRLVRGGSLKVWKGRSQGKGKLAGNVEAHPYIRPAWEQSKSATLEKFEGSFRSRVDDYVKKKKRG